MADGTVSFCALVAQPRIGPRWHARPMLSLDPDFAVHHRRDRRTGRKWWAIVDTIPPGTVTELRAAPEGSSYPGRVALARLGRRAALPKAPALRKVAATRADLPAVPMRPIPVVYGWAVAREGYGSGVNAWARAEYRDTWSVRDFPADSAKRLAANKWRPIPRVGTWNPATWQRTGADWYAEEAARVIVRYEGGEMRLVPGPDADKVIARVASSVTAAREDDHRARALTGQQPEPVAMPEEPAPVFARDAIMRRALRGADRVRVSGWKR